MMPTEGKFSPTSGFRGNGMYVPTLHKEEGVSAGDRKGFCLILTEVNAPVSHPYNPFRSLSKERHEVN